MTFVETTRGTAMEDHSVTFTKTFDLTQEQVLSIVPIAVDVKGTFDGNKTLSIDTTGLGAGSSETLKIVAGNGMSLSADGSGSFELDGTTYNISSNGTKGNATGNSGTANIVLKEDGNETDNKGQISFSAGKQMVLDGSANNAISYSHADITTTTPEVQNADNKNYSASLSYVKSVETSNGHVTKIETETYKVPSAQEFYPTLSVNKGTIAVELKDRTKHYDPTNNAINTSTLDSVLYHTINGQKIYNTEELPVYTKD
jgi:hypothetical protein